MVGHHGMFQFHPEVTSDQIDECFTEMCATVRRIPGHNVEVTGIKSCLAHSERIIIATLSRRCGPVRLAGGILAESCIHCP